MGDWFTFVYKFPLKCGERYCILYALSYRPSVCDKAALVGESAVPCYLQSATAGMNSRPRNGLYRLPHISGDEESVLRNGSPRTMSGGEPSSIKWTLSCAVSSPLLSWLYGFRVWIRIRRRVCGLIMDRIFNALRKGVVDVVSGTLSEISAPDL